MIYDLSALISKVKKEDKIFTSSLFQDMMKNLSLEEYERVHEDYAILFSPIFDSISFSSLEEEEKRALSIKRDDEILAHMMLHLSTFFLSHQMTSLINSYRLFLTYLALKDEK